jgi:hypothetical protein
MSSTFTAQIEIQRSGDSDVDDAQESLILAFEFLLIEDLNGDDGRVLDGTEKWGRMRSESDKEEWICFVCTSE